MNSLSLRLWEIWSHIVMTVIAISFINFWWVFVEHFYIGGDALNGYMSNGHYYLSTQTQLRYIEVSEYVWKWSYFHSLSVFALIILCVPLGFFTFFVFHPALKLIRKAEQQHTQVVTVEASGYRLYRQLNCRVILGNLRPPILAILQVYPGGFILLAYLAGRIAITRSEIMEIHRRRSVFTSWYDIHIKIDSLPSPISISSQLFVGNDIGQALTLLFPNR